MAKTILIAEDEPTMSETLANKLASIGLNVLHASDGDAALKKIQQKKPDLVIMDIVMPKRNGLDVVRAMRADGLTTPVIVLSNLDRPEDLEATKSLGVAQYLVKSDVSLRTLVSCVTKELHKTEKE